jgi:hypothetical protein
MNLISDIAGPTPLVGESENSVDIEDVRIDVKTDLIMLNGELTDLNRKFDLTAVLRPLLDDQGPALQHIQRMRNQMEHMIKIKDNFLRKQQERKEQERKEQERKEQERKEQVQTRAAAAASKRRRTTS